MPSANVGPLGQALGPLARPVGSQLVGGHDLVDQPEALRVVGRQVVAEEHQLLRLRQPDQPRQQISAAGIDGDAAADEDLDEARVARRR